MLRISARVSVGKPIMKKPQAWIPEVADGRGGDGVTIGPNGPGRAIREPACLPARPRAS